MAIRFRLATSPDPVCVCELTAPLGLSQPTVSHHLKKQRVGTAKTMPGWLPAFVDVNPVTILADATRGLLVGGPVAGPVTGSLLWAATITVVFAPLSVWAFKRRVW